MAITGAVTAVAAAGTTVYGAVKQSDAQSDQAAYQKQQFDYNAGQAETSAEDAERRGGLAVAQIQRQGKQVLGQQRVGMGAQGVDVNNGSAAEVQADSQEANERDVMTTQNNAWREAWGYRQQGGNFVAQGNQAQAAGNTLSTNTLLTGGASAIGTLGTLAGKNYGGSLTPLPSGQPSYPATENY